MQKSDSNLDKTNFCAIYINGRYLCCVRGSLCAMRYVKTYYKSNCRKDMDVMYIRFCGKLVYWCENDKEQIFRNFRNISKGEGLVNEDGLYGAIAIGIYEDRAKKLEDFFNNELNGKKIAFC